MTKPILLTWLGAFLATVVVSITWHAILFERAYLDLGVFTRMDHPDFLFGTLAWVFEASAMTALFLRSSWRHEGFAGAVSLSVAANLYLAGSTLMGTAAKVQITDLTTFFVLAGGFLILHTLVFALWLSFAQRKILDQAT